MTLDANAPKFRAAQTAASLVQNGMSVGLGSGTTSALVVRAIGERVANEGLKIVGVPTSVATAELAASLKIALRELDDLDSLDLNIDGADEVDPHFRMVKGRGGALLREKIVASCARRRVTVITDDKQVERLGVKAPIPVEVSSIGTRHIEARLRQTGATTTMRMRSDGSPYVTDGGNRIVDCHFHNDADPSTIDATLQQIVGVFETGLFIGLCDLLIVGSETGVEQKERRLQS